MTFSGPADGSPPSITRALFCFQEELLKRTGGWAPVIVLGEPAFKGLRIEAEPHLRYSPDYSPDWRAPFHIFPYGHRTRIEIAVDAIGLPEEERARYGRLARGILEQGGANWADIAALAHFVDRVVGPGPG